LREMYESFRVTRNEIRKIAYWQSDPDQPNERGPNSYTKLLAQKALVELDVLIFNSQLSGGKFERKLGAISLRYTPVEPELLDQMMNALQNWKLLPDAKAAKAMIKHVEHKELGTGTANVQAGA
jgi:tRNA U34 5-methylaminomethyl-2-thiouridine-forming methyltransferase MnmC